VKLGNADEHFDGALRLFVVAQSEKERKILRRSHSQWSAGALGGDAIPYHPPVERIARDENVHAHVTIRNHEVQRNEIELLALFNLFTLDTKAAVARHHRHLILLFAAHHGHDVDRTVFNATAEPR